MAIEQPAIIDEINGNIVLHAQEGKLFTLFFQDEDGAPRNMTTATVELQIKGKPAIPMLPGPDVNSMILTIEPADLTGLLGKSTPFVWLDKTLEVPDAFWTGELIVVGF